LKKGDLGEGRNSLPLGGRGSGCHSEEKKKHRVAVGKNWKGLAHKGESLPRIFRGERRNADMKKL